MSLSDSPSFSGTKPTRWIWTRRNNSHYNIVQAWQLLNLPQSYAIYIHLAYQGRTLPWHYQTGIVLMALIIFDYDGVLADTLDDLVRSGQRACDRLGVKHIVRRADINNLEEMSFTSFGRACEVPEQLLDEFVEICLEFFSQKQSPPAIFPGLSEVIQHLSANHVLAVVTTNSSQNVHAFLLRHALDGFIRAVYGVDAPGTKAQKICLARDQLLPANMPEPAYMVGDSLSDIRAAQETSVMSVAVAWGHQSLEYLQRGNPDYVIHAPQQLIEVVEQLKA
jgi:phosphoglycolate phosphatase